MAHEYPQLRQAVLAYLRERVLPGLEARPEDRPQQGWMGNNTGVVAYCAERDMPLDDADKQTILEIFHDLHIERVIAPGGGPHATQGALEWPHYWITGYGRKILAETHYSPYDPDGYLAKLVADIPELDSTIVRYTAEALGCLRHGFLFGAAVMLGCAAEKALLELIDAYTCAISNTGRQTQFSEELSNRGIKRKFDLFRARLTTVLSSLPPDLQDDLEIMLERAFDLIRRTRNDAGHPVGRDIHRDAVHANLILFPLYCRRVYGLIEHFQSQTV